MYCMTDSTSNPSPIINSILESVSNSNFMYVFLNMLDILILVQLKN